MAITMTHIRNPLSPEDLDKLEQKIGLKLAEPYREFLLLYNGGRPKPNLFPLANNASDSHGMLLSFLCVQEGDVYHLPTWIRRLSDRVPSGFIPIAVDPGGNVICLALSGDKQGKVYFWDHEEEVEEGQVPGFQNMYLIADDFETFLRNFQAS